MIILFKITIYSFKINRLFQNINYHDGMIDDKNIKTVFGSTVKELRIQKNITQEQLAESIGLQPQTITKIETGRVFVSSETLALLCNFFNVEPALFFRKKLNISAEDLVDYQYEIKKILSSLSKARQKDIYNIILALQN